MFHKMRDAMALHYRPLRMIDKINQYLFDRLNNCYYQATMNTARETSIQESLGYWVSLLSRSMEAEFNFYLAPHGLTRMSYAVLGSMVFDRQVTPSDIADALGVDRAAVTRLLDKLEAQALIARDHDTVDRRSIHLKVLPRGEALAREMQACSRSVNARFTKALTNEEIERFIELAKTMLRDAEVRPKRL